MNIYVNRSRLPLLILSALCFFISCGCVRQRIDLTAISQGTHGGSVSLRHFRTSAYSVYVLFDLVEVSPADVSLMMQEVNPENKPVVNLTVTSEADPLAVLVNLLNGGVIYRGVFVSLNKLTIEGDIIEKRYSVDGSDHNM